MNEPQLFLFIFAPEFLHHVHIDYGVVEIRCILYISLWKPHVTIVIPVS